MAESKSITIPPRTKDETGNPHGALTVLCYAGQDNRRKALWLCRCQCGNEVTVSGNHLRSGHTASCGCIRQFTHGMCSTSEYQSWKMMKARCYNPNASGYHRYGGRKPHAITVCDRWVNSFTNFFEDMGEKPFVGATLERIDNDARYEKSNCKWASRGEQSNNTSQTRLLTFNGETLCLKDWAKKIGISESALRYRLASGWSTEKALSTSPVPPSRHSGVIILTHNNETMSLQEWARRLDIKPDTIYQRMNMLGWSIEKTLTTPTRQHK